MGLRALHFGVLLVLIAGWCGGAEGAVLSLPPESFPKIATAADLGQTITAPSGPENVLDSYTFYGFAVQSDVKFESSVYKYDVSTNRVVSGALFTSDLRTAAKGVFQGFTFDTGGVALEPGANYLLVLQQKGWGNPTNLQLSFSTVAYDGGDYRVSDDPGRYQGTGRSWSGYAGQDLGLTAEFSAAAPVGVPTPTGLGAGSAVACGVVARRFRWRK